MYRPKRRTGFFLFLFNNQPDAPITQIYSVLKLYMFRASSLPIIRSFLLYIRYWFHAGLMTASKQSHDFILTLLGSGHQTCMKPTNALGTVENS